MILGFQDKETARLFRRETIRRLPPNIQRPALRKLWMIDAAQTLGDLLIPLANRLEKLHGTRRGQHSIRINDQWRICFRWSQGHAYDVEITDYH